jgi:hypothetical protein
LSDSFCSVCGNRFDTKDHKLAMEHPNLFGGVDKICKSCFNKMEKIHRQRMGESERPKRRNRETSL